ncbi:hypothetical protein PR048_008680 [Dryococelus australis]|uniref:Uncharacterized protein n=1 Tax=Dryococelus australis TaxID=614101 RepID=A0ABQ9HXS2_9NEOP|nr:hypothetical protein PR048_008680 [Dryococelus australis]
MEKRWDEREGENGISPRKPTDQRHRLARFPYVKIREQPHRESNPVRLQSSQFRLWWKSRLDGGSHQELEVLQAGILPRRWEAMFGNGSNSAARGRRVDRKLWRGDGRIITSVVKEGGGGEAAPAMPLTRVLRPADEGVLDLPSVPVLISLVFGGFSDRQRSAGEDLSPQPTASIRQACSICETYTSSVLEIVKPLCVESGYITVALDVEVLRADEGEVSRAWSSAGMQGRGKLKIHEKNTPSRGIVRHDSHVRKPLASPSGIEPGSSWWKAGRLTIRTTASRWDRVGLWRRPVEIAGIARKRKPWLYSEERVPYLPQRADLPWRSRLMRHRSGVLEPWIRIPGKAWALTYATPYAIRVKRGVYGATPECKGRGNGRSRENPLTSSIVRLDSHTQKYRSDPIGNRTHRGHDGIVVRLSIPPPPRVEQGSIPGGVTRTSSYARCQLRLRPSPSCIASPPPSWIPGFTSLSFQSCDRHAGFRHVVSHYIWSCSCTPPRIFLICHSSSMALILYCIISRRHSGSLDFPLCHSAAANLEGNECHSDENETDTPSCKPTEDSDPTGSEIISPTDRPTQQEIISKLNVSIEAISQIPTCPKHVSTPARRGAQQREVRESRMAAGNDAIQDECHRRRMTDQENSRWNAISGRYVLAGKVAESSMAVT